MNIVFYQMMATSLEKTLPKLLEKAYEQQQKAVVVLSDIERLKLIDDVLWTSGKLSFLPHGSELKHNQFKDLQPIWLTLAIENPNGADIVVITNGQLEDSACKFKRCLDLFDGHDSDQVAAAHERLKFYKNRGDTCAWWVQSLDGKWNPKEL